MSASGRDQELQNPAREVFIFAITVISIVNLVLLLVPGVLTAQQADVLRLIDAVLTLFFVIDVVARLRAASSKRHYLLHERGWLDVLGSIPLLRILRIFRLIRAWGIMRRYGLRRMVRLLLHDRARSALYLILLLVVVVFEVAGTLVLHFEAGDPQANITTGGDALWWCLVTVTTVGYGDQYPVTPGGRVVGVFLLITGVILFATLSGYLANAFLSAGSAPAPDAPPPAADGGMEEVLGLLRRQEAEIRALHARLDGLGGADPP